MAMKWRKYLGGQTSLETEVSDTNPLPVTDPSLVAQEPYLSNIQELLERLTGLTRALGIAADLRVTLLGGTTAVTGTLTGVTTVTGLTNIGGLPAVQHIPSVTNTTAVLSNINNVTH